MSEISSLWRSLLDVLDELKAKVDPIFHKDVDAITEKARAAKSAAEKAAQEAVAEEKPVIEEAVSATVATAQKAAETVESAVTETGKGA